MKTSEIDALFELPLADFTAARNALAAQLKKQGRADEAQQVKAMPKPSATAWAVNQLFWRDSKAFERLLVIGDKARKAQTGNAAGFRALLDERRAVVSGLTDQAAAILRDAGHAASSDATRRISMTLESLASWGRSGDGPQPGRLISDLEPLGFDGLAALLDGRKLEQATVLAFRRPEKKTMEDAAAARELAKRAVQAAESALTAARQAAQRADAALAKANARLESVERQKQEIEAEARKAHEESRDASREVKEAAQAVAGAERSLEKARAALAEKK